MLAYGPPIVQGSVSTLLGVAPLALLESYLMQTFAKMVALVVSFGVLHGLLILPVMMVLLDQPCKKCEEDEQQSAQHQVEGAADANQEQS